MSKKLRSLEAQALLEEFGQQVLGAMDKAFHMGLDARRLQTVVEEAAINWHAPARRKKPKERESLYEIMTPSCERCGTKKGKAAPACTGAKA